MVRPIASGNFFSDTTFTLGPLSPSASSTPPADAAKSNPEKMRRKCMDRMGRVFQRPWLTYSHCLTETEFPDDEACGINLSLDTSPECICHGKASVLIVGGKHQEIVSGCANQAVFSLLVWYQWT